MVRRIDQISKNSGQALAVKILQKPALESITCNQCGGNNRLFGLKKNRLPVHEIAAANLGKPYDR